MDGAVADERAALRVVLAASAAERQRVQRFRLETLRRERGLAADADLPPGLAEREELSALADHYFIEQAGRIRAALWQIGTITPQKLPSSLRQAFVMERFADYGHALSVTDAPVVDSDWPGGEAVAMLVAAAFKSACQLGREIDFTHCELANTGLYQKLGYRRYAPHFYDADERVRTPLLMLLKDLGHLRAVNSPFIRLATALPNDRAAANWFARHFPDAPTLDAKRLRDEERFWRFLTKRLQQTPLTSIPLFRGLSYADALRFLHQAKLLALETGDCLVRAGSTGNEMYVVLAGRLHVEVERAGRRHRLAVIGPGGLAGEMSFLTESPRTADLVAGETCEVLVLTQATVRRAMEDIPKIAASVLLHLSLVLCERLGHATRDLLNSENADAA